jgi:ribosomal protein S18 acetylase RimI-like enzyme
MSIHLFDDCADVDAGRLRIEDLQVVAVDRPGGLLDACHDLLLRAFDPAVVDPKRIYVDAVNDQSGAFRDFAPLFFAALFDVDGEQLVAGFISSDAMAIGDSDVVHLAVGNIATTPRLRDVNFRGVGRKLLEAALNAGRLAARDKGANLKYSTAEAEAASLPFWAKMGFRWPQGVRYFQPPLDFDADGQPVHPEVPETLVVKVLEGLTSAIDGGELREIVRSIYWNWSLRAHSKSLTPAAFSAARAYVMDVLEKTFASISPDESIPLVEPPRHAA